MTLDSLLVDQNPHWGGDLYDAGVSRSQFPQLLQYLETGQVVAVTGVRRSGKSTLLKQLINHLIQEAGVPPANLFFLNLEHPSLSPYRDDATALQQIYEEYLRLMQPQGLVTICLDEVQFFREWPLFVKAHHEMKRVRFVVTGSNAAMLASDMMTLLSGRTLPLEIYPLSFRELAESRGIQLNSPSSAPAQAPALRHLLEEHLEVGGFPIVALGEHREAASEILGAHARTVLLLDVAPRLRLRKPADLERLYVYLVSHIGKLFSYGSLAKVTDLTDKSIKEYILALQDAYLLFELEPFSFSLKRQMRAPKKIYAIDTGQAHAMGFQFSPNRGRFLENLIFIDLKRLGFEIYYVRTRSGREVDFAIRRGNELSLIQVAWNLQDPETRERELRALEEAMEEFNCTRATLIVAEPTPSIEGVQLLVAHRFLALPSQERKSLLAPD